ncbi:MAG TPA: glycosyltransferase family 4 protein [Thermoanaerobaculia bacterium]
MYRVALVASHVIQYQAPFYRLLAQHPEIDLTVLYSSRAGAEVYRDREMQTSLRWDVDLLSGYRHRFLRNAGWGEGYSRLLNPGVIPAVLSRQFDAVILFMGWGTITSLLAIAACRMSGTPFFLFGDSSFPPPEETATQQLRAGFLRAIFRMAGGFLVSGTLNRDYYRHYGADPARFFLVPWAIDNERFTSASRMSADERNELRQRFGATPDDVVIVYSAKLLPRKDPMTLLRGVAAMRHRKPALVLFLGHGELRDSLERFAREENLRVHFAGFVNQADLPRYYAAGDIFVLPSVYEPRGAVVNEAMACGLPVIVTDRCGSNGDIVREGDNAFVFPAGNALHLAVHLDTLAEDPHFRARMAQRSTAIIAEWSYERGVEGVLAALQATRRGAPC